MNSSRYDAIVIGAGQGGVPLAVAFAQAGWRTAMVERSHVGGTCVNEGCTPTKTMVASARVAHLARRATDYGIHAGMVNTDMRAVRERKRAIVANFRSGGERRLQQAGVELIRGDASFTTRDAVQVMMHEGGAREIQSERIIINTGLRTALPTIAGLEAIPALDSTSIMELDTLPSHLIVLGGGYVGLEFAQMFRRFGSEVTVVHRGRQLLPREDADIADAVAAVLTQDGLRLQLDAATTRLECASGGGVTLSFRRGTSGSAETGITGSHLLVATGRTPNTESLSPAGAGITTDERGFVRVNEYLETNVPGIWAIGDVNGGPAFTHISYDDFRILSANLIRGERRSTTGRQLPYTVFTDPQLGRIGVTETEARAAGRPIRVATMPMAYVARALETDEPRGLLKVIVDAESEQILGAAVLGLEGGEIASLLQVAMMGKLRYTSLRDGIFSHPTLAESMNNLFQSFVS